MSPSRGSIDIEALSGVCGSISIACWVVVFSPQIIENFRRSSAEGLSLTFIIIWLLGDVFNILGAVLQGVLPTMIILAVYYTVADIVLLGQCLYYRRFDIQRVENKTLDRQGYSDGEANAPAASSERDPLLAAQPSSTPTDDDGPNRTLSNNSIPTLPSPYVDPTRLSPATPFVPIDPSSHRQPSSNEHHDSSPASPPTKRSSVFKGVIFNTTSLLLVSAAGAGGWFLLNPSHSSHHHPRHNHHDYLFYRKHHSLSHESELQFDLWGQIFGYLCAVFYLASRLPQIILNYRRKSTEGVSMLFFLFACVGNATYVVSILAYSPSTCALDAPAAFAAVDWAGGCDGRVWSAEYARYILVNLSWLIGSAGTLGLDLAIFAQFWVYRQ